MHETSDYSDDEAHDAASERDGRDPHLGTGRPGVVPTPADRDPDGDDGYHLAHDLPRPDRHENRGP